MRVALVPARNEGRHILGVLASLKRFVDLTVVVDDASEDETDQIAVGSGSVVIRNESHAGYGASIRKGLEWCWENGVSVVVTIDGDGQHKGEWIEEGMLLVQEGADVVFANRFSRVEGIPQTKLLSNNFAWYCVKKILQKPPVCRDVSCGFRIYGRRSLVPALETPNKVTSGYAFTQATCLELHRSSLRLAVLNVPAIYPENVQGTAVSEMRDFLLWLVHCTPLHTEAGGWLEDLESGTPFRVPSSPPFLFKLTDPTNWNASSIVVSVPSGATTGNVVVHASGMAATYSGPAEAVSYHLRPPLRFKKESIHPRQIHTCSALKKRSIVLTGTANFRRLSQSALGLITVTCRQGTSARGPSQKATR